MGYCRLLIVFILFSFRILCQVNADCIQALPLCSNPGFTFFATSGPGAVSDFSAPALSTVSNPSPNPNPPNLGCMLTGELNPQWVILKISNAGYLEFVFGALNSNNPQVGFYDWALWPYTSNSCANIQNNSLAPIRCNWNGIGSGGTGIASSTNIAALGGSSVNFETPVQVNACDEFVLCISNYSGVNTLVSFLSLGSASIVCSPVFSVQNVHSCSQTATLIAPSGYSSYQWYNSTGPISNLPLITTSVAGSYSLVYGNGNLCPQPNNVFQLTISAQNLSLTSTNTLICEGETATLSAGVLSNYTWSNGSGSSSVAISPLQNTTYSLSTLDNYNCVITNTITQFVSPCTSLNDNSKAAVKINLFPNPNRGEFEVEIFGLNGNFDLIIKSLNEVVVHQQKVKTGRNRIILDEHSSGIYFYSIRQHNSNLANGKISIE